MCLVQVPWACPAESSDPGGERGLMVGSAPWCCSGLCVRHRVPYRHLSATYVQMAPLGTTAVLATVRISLCRREERFED